MLKYKLNNTLDIQKTNMELMLNIIKSSIKSY